MVPPDKMKSGTRAQPRSLAPVPMQNGSTGLLIADNRFSLAPITESEVDLTWVCASFAGLILPAEREADFSGGNVAPNAPREKHSFSITQQFHPRFDESPSDVMRRALSDLCENPDVFGASVIFVDERAQRAVDIIVGGRDEKFDLDLLIRPDGQSIRAIRRKQHVAIPDVDREPNLNPHTRRSDIRASVCFPLEGPDGAFAVMWIHYLKPQSFPESFLQPLQSSAP